MLVESYLLFLILESKYEKFAVGQRRKDQKLVIGHVQIEISSLCYYFPKKSETNNMNVVITGKRQLEVRLEFGLVIPATVQF